MEDTSFSMCVKTELCRKRFLFLESESEHRKKDRQLCKLKNVHNPINWSRSRDRTIFFFCGSTYNKDYDHTARLPDNCTACDPRLDTMPAYNSSAGEKNLTLIPQENLHRVRKICF